MQNKFRSKTEDANCRVMCRGQRRQFSDRLRFVIMMRLAGGEVSKLEVGKVRDGWRSVGEEVRTCAC